MRRGKGFGVLCGLILLLQVGLAAGGVILSRLAYQKAGVNHHVAFKKRQYNALIFTEGNLLLFSIILGIVMALLVLLLIRMVQRKHTVSAIIAGWCLLGAGLLLFSLLSPAMQALSIYPYAVLLIALGWGFSLIPLVVHPVKNKNLL